MERGGIFLRLNREEGNAFPERFIVALMLPALAVRLPFMLAVDSWMTVGKCHFMSVALKFLFECIRPGIEVIQNGWKV